MSKTKQIKEILTQQLHHLEDELDAFLEELARLSDDDPEKEFIKDQIEAIEIAMGQLEEEIELLR